MSVPKSTLDTSGIVIGSRDPDRLIAWYRAALEPLGARWETHRLVVGDGMYVGFDSRDDIAEKSSESGRHLVNFHVSDIRSTEEHLDALGVRWVRPVELTEYGAWSTVEDPDGNYVQFIQITGVQG
jgi:catechol 2,3-dioxygenase-like lactoylglutathione lyase family enzyme